MVTDRAKKVSRVGYILAVIFVLIKSVQLHWCSLFRAVVSPMVHSFVKKSAFSNYWCGRDEKVCFTC